MAQNSMNSKNLYLIENKGAELKAIRAYLLRLYSETSHTRWITPNVLFHYNSLLVTDRQMDHVRMWVKKKLKIEIKFQILEIPVDQG
jgi:hypothetical protein